MDKGYSYVGSTLQTESKMQVTGMILKKTLLSLFMDGVQLPQG